MILGLNRKKGKLTHKIIVLRVVSSTLFLSLILQSCHKVLVLVRKENMARLKIGKNRPNVLLGLRSKYVFELNLMIGPTLISVVARTYLGSWMGG